MGLYRFYLEHILPRGVQAAMRAKKFDVERARCLAGLRGRVLELGFGAGLNLPHYPPEVTEVLALEPAQLNRRLARGMIESSQISVSWLGLDGASIPLDAGSIDSVACTWTLCTIPDLDGALREVRRVLAPGGRLHFLEHGRARDPKTARWQERLTPLQKIFAGGCRLDVQVDERIQGSGLEVIEVEQYALPGARLTGWLFRGVAINA